MKHLPKITSTLLVFLALAACSRNTETKNLPESTPEAQGVSSDSIIRFIDAVANSKNELHGFVFLRHGYVVAQGWWNPYAPELKHTLYSTSKSFTATAVGFAVSENKIKVDDKVVSFFPESLPDTVSPYLSSLTIKDLLTMSAGQEPDPTGMIVNRDSNWVKSFLSLPIVNKPGTKFLYNSMASYMLSAIVQKVTGQKIIDYLTPRLFEPLGIEGMDWETDPRGINTGGWGLRLKTEDIAKFGQLFLQKGKWHGKQILPAEWVEEASAKHIEQAPDAPQSRKDSSDWMQGYCYQMWRCRNNAYRADGAFGQYIIIMPDKDAVIAINSETPDMQDVLNLVWKYLLPSMQDHKLPENKSSDNLLRQQIAGLALPVPPKNIPSPLEASLNAKTFTLIPNELADSTISFHFYSDSATMELFTAGTSFEIPMGNGHWIESRTMMKGPNLLLRAKGHLVGIPSVMIAAAYTWRDEKTLEIILRYIESPHHQTLVCRFDHKVVQLEIQNSQDFGRRTFYVTGNQNE